MLDFHHINPVAFKVGPIAVYWYGLMYVLGFLVSYLVMMHRRHTLPFTLSENDISNLLFYSAIGVVLGGRIGFVLLYEPGILFDYSNILTNLWARRGRSFHGGLLGVLVACYFFCRSKKIFYFELMDFLAPAVPIGLGLGRIGNFINGELWGRVSDVPWAMVFPGAGPLPRHPSQLYECLLEGFLLFIVLYSFSRKPRPMGQVSGMFLMCYGLFRIIAEFFREPDLNIGFLVNALTMGQVLSIPMIASGLFLFLTAKTPGRTI